jgi:hypothetical protein
MASMLAYVSKTDLAIRQIEKLSWDWIKMDCSGGKCYGLLAVSYTLCLIASERQIDKRRHERRSIGSNSLLSFSTVS